MASVEMFPTVLAWTFDLGISDPFGISGPLGLVHNSAPNSVRHDNVGRRVCAEFSKFNVLE